MSFRKRGEVLAGGRLPNRAPLVPGRTPGGTPSTPGDAGVNRLSGRMEQLNLRGGVRANISGRPLADGRTAASGPNKDPISAFGVNHPGIRPSPASSQPATSTGCFDLDKVLGHMGLPLGTSLLIEERNFTEFNSVLVKLMCSQGIIHNRVEDNKEKNGNTHLIILSASQSLGKELPGVYKGSKKDIKKSKISEEQKKLSVQNLNEEKSTPSRYKDLKIAWKYKFVDEQRGVKNAEAGDSLSSEYPNYNHQFDITSRLLPAPTSNELTFINPTEPVASIINKLDRTIQQHSNKLIRIVIPSLLHPATYPPRMFLSSEVLLLMHGLRGILKKYSSRCVLMGTISTDIIDSFLLAQLENFFDSVLNLEPFGQDMMQFLERIYKTQPGKIQQGLLHIMKLPVFSERGEMHVMKSELAFKNGRKKFEIEEWGIPVDDVEDDKPEKQNNPNETDMSNTIAAPKKSTKVSLEY